MASTILVHPVVLDESCVAVCRVALFRIVPWASLHVTPFIRTLIDTLETSLPPPVFFLAYLSRPSRSLS